MSGFDLGGFFKLVGLVWKDGPTVTAAIDRAGQVPEIQECIATLPILVTGVKAALNDPVVLKGITTFIDLAKDLLNAKSPHEAVGALCKQGVPKAVAVKVVEKHMGPVDPAGHTQPQV
jgi:hypothetical protein